MSFTEHQQKSHSPYWETGDTDCCERSTQPIELCSLYNYFLIPPLKNHVVLVQHPILHQLRVIPRTIYKYGGSTDCRTVLYPLASSLQTGSLKNQPKSFLTFYRHTIKTHQLHSWVRHFVKKKYNSCSAKLLQPGSNRYERMILKMEGGRGTQNGSYVTSAHSLRVSSVVECNRRKRSAKLKMLPKAWIS